MSAFPKIETGIAGFDILTRGGIPQGRTTLIAGKSGTCKSILSLQIASNLARRGMTTMLVAVEEAPDDLIMTGDSLGFETGRLVESGLIRMLDLTRPLEGPTFVSGDYDVSGLLHRIEGAVKNVAENEFANAVIKLLMDSQLQQQLAQSGRKFVENHYDWQVILGKMNDVYVQIHQGNA